jgi:hypothetical protein
MKACVQTIRRVFTKTCCCTILMPLKPINLKKGLSSLLILYAGKKVNLLNHIVVVRRCIVDSPPTQSTFNLPCTFLLRLPSSRGTSLASLENSLVGSCFLLFHLPFLIQLREEARSLVLSSLWTSWGNLRPRDLSVSDRLKTRTTTRHTPKPT